MIIPIIYLTGKSAILKIILPLVEEFWKLNFNKRSEELNQQIEESRGELADYNMVLERLNTASSISDLRNDNANLKLHNDQETKSLDILFIEKGK